MALEYFTLSEFRALPDVARFSDARVDSIAASVVADIEDYCGFSFIPRAKTSRVVGGSKLVLPHAPAVALTSVTGYSSGALTLGDLYLDTGAGTVEYNSGSSFGDTYYTVVYTAGLSAVPAGIKEATMQATKMRLIERDGAAAVGARRQSVSTDGQSVTFVPPGEGRLFGYPDIDPVFERARSVMGFA